MKNNLTQISILIPSFLFLLTACDPGIVSIGAGDPATCEGCHTNKDVLKKLVAEENATAPSGGG
ncbi:MAG: hypothetical protein HN657_02515 [Candidatus Marinimicrobia bacterium]|jgi:hypothetical protein|nr:hypothetical protein [Candidatus Neomarinimicrobiota bacterium]MBT3496402.1 hypothetical protein [Candidatus Neomarinimicrobiota bacterium]MBT3732326.1 hypothetical protein [Candidatus Neomarinimicrobiota bacterium]MBT4143648.1 hypothetical protein [Candidatus Neomarinimicrobiota bacterium]MBT4176817.1 hypothetical protein [Candidatus Neomarinimicrobiota bacterium]